MLIHPSVIVERCDRQGRPRLFVLKAGQIKAVFLPIVSGRRAAKLAVLRLDNREIYDAALDLVLGGAVKAADVDKVIEASLNLLTDKQFGNNGCFRSYDGHWCHLVKQRINEVRRERGYRMALKPGGGGPLEKHRFEFKVFYGGGL